MLEHHKDSVQFFISDDQSKTRINKNVPNRTTKFISKIIIITEMGQTTTDLTKQYIKDNPYIKKCLKKNLINYSSLARLIAKDLNIEKKTSKEAILIAARRFKEELKREHLQETKIKELLSASEFEIKNKIAVFILEKNIHFEGIEVIQKAVRNAGGTFYILEGSDNYTLITSEKFENLISSKMKGAIIKKETGLALINVK